MFFRFGFFLISFVFSSSLSWANECITSYSLAETPLAKAATMECAVNIELAKKKMQNALSHGLNINFPQIYLDTVVGNETCSPATPCFTLLTEDPRPFRDSLWIKQTELLGYPGEFQNDYINKEDGYYCFYDNFLGQFICIDLSDFDSRDYMTDSVYLRYCHLIFNSINNPAAQAILLECAVNRSLVEYRIRDIWQNGMNGVVGDYFSSSIIGDAIVGQPCSPTNPCLNRLNPHMRALIDSRWTKTDYDTYENINDGFRCDYDPQAYLLTCRNLNLGP